MHYTSVPCSKALQIWSLTANYSCLLCQISAYNRQLGVCLHSSLCFTNFLILITFNFTFSNWRGKETQKRLTHNVFSTFSSLKLDSWTFTKAVKYWYCRVYWGVHLETTTTKKKTTRVDLANFPVTAEDVCFQSEKRPQSIHDFPHQMVLKDRFSGHLILCRTFLCDIKEESPPQAEAWWAL